MDQGTAAAGAQSFDGTSRGMSQWRWSSRAVVVVAVVAALQVGGTVVAAEHQDAPRNLDEGGLLLLALGALLLPLRRRSPAGVLLAVFAATLGYGLAGYPSGPIFIALIVALTATFQAHRRRVAYATLAAGFVSFTWLTAAVAHRPAPGFVTVVGLAAWLLLLAAGCELWQARVAARQAEQARHAESARTQEEAFRRRLIEDRLELARELHDVLGHSLSMINVQAAVALELQVRGPQQAYDALRAIKEASRGALDDVQSVLDALRDDQEAAPVTPFPTTIALDALVARARAAGLPVTTTVSGKPADLPAAVQLTVARIVQEALTNVARHAGLGARADVSMRYGRDEVVVRVRDAGGHARPPRGSVSAGSGLIGMRHRAALLGGTVTTGPCPGGGFAVEARLPNQRDRS